MGQITENTTKLICIPCHHPRKALPANMAQTAPAKGDDDIPTYNHPCKTKLTTCYIIMDFFFPTIYIEPRETMEWN